MADAELGVIEREEQTNPWFLEQSELLLRTKLFVPSIRPNRVARPHLFEQINSGLNKALILISAPAGYGKTTLVSSWLHETEISSTWISLDEDDNDPIRFLHYFITALHQIVPAIKLDLLSVLQDTKPASYRFLLNIIINETARRASPLVLVLDDFHAIEAQSVLEIITYLLEHLPPQMHIVLLSRTDPPLPLSRLRARNQLLDIRADQLRFTQEEIALFLNQMMGLKLATEDIIALERRTEGWIAGLQLASLALQATILRDHTSTQGSDVVHSFVSAFTGSHYYIMDYLVEEVLKFQTESVRSFLLRSSILDRMCGPLCDDILKTDQTGSINGQATLEALEQMNLFIIPLDSERRWYRYHHLFADVLNRHLEQLYPHLLSDLHCRASQWYEQKGYIFDAIHHALLAGDQERAAQLVDQNGCLLLMRGEVVNLLDWIKAVEPYSRSYPWIAIQKAWALCLAGQLDEAEGPLDIAGQLVSSLRLTDEVRTMSGAVTAARAYRANIQGETHLAANLAQQALNSLPESSDFSCSLRGVATSILGDACSFEGNLAEAERAYADAALISQAAGNIYMVIIANSNLAETLVEQGKLHQAARVYSETLKLATLSDGEIPPLAERIYAGLSRISYEWNHLEDAENHVQRCIEFSRRRGSHESQASGYVILAKLEHVAGNPEKAREAIRSAEQLISEHSFTPWRSSSLESALARFWIALGEWERAFHFVQKSDIQIDNVPAKGVISYLQEPVYLTLLHVHLARGDYDAVLALSERLLLELDETKRTGWVTKILVLRALAYQEKRNLDQALAVLKQALSLAQPHGYIRTFLDEGEPMAKLLYQARSHRIGAGYAAELLSAMGHAFGSTMPPAELLIEPLTLRELEILKLIETGYSNQKIATELFISIPTVKRHISNIYAKLGVSSRTQAVSRGKELKLVE